MEGKLALNPAGMVRNLSSYYNEAQQGNYDFYSDFQLVSDDGQVIKTHRIILASQCGYYRGLLRANPSLTSSTVPVAFPVLKACIESLYSGLLPDFPPNNSEDVKEILLAANYLGIEEIVSAYSNKLIADVDDSNCFELLQWSYDNCVLRVQDGVSSHVSQMLIQLREETNGDIMKLPDSPFMLGLKGLSKECIFPILIKFGSGIQTRVSKLQCNLHNTKRVMYMLIKLIKNYTDQTSANNLPEEVQAFIREKVFSRCLKAKAPVNGIIMSLLDNEILTRNMTLEHRIDVFLKSFVLEEILSAVAEVTNGTVTYSILQSFRDDKGSFEHAFSFYMSLMPSCLLKKPRDPFVVVETHCSNEYGTHQERAWRYNYEPGDVHLGIIRKISISNRLWDNRNVVKGLELFFQNHETPVIIGLGDIPSEAKKRKITQTFELRESEYISYVQGRAGWMIDQLTFVTNQNRKFGPVGGNGGSTFCTLTGRHKSLLKLRGDTARIMLRGIVAVEGEQQGSLAIGRIRFISTVMCTPGLEEMWCGALV